MGKLKFNIRLETTARTNCLKVDNHSILRILIVLRIFDDQLELMGVERKHKCKI